MIVSELMSNSPRTCRPDDVCAVPARHMWEGDCGCVVVTHHDGAVAGVVTDRDLCIASYTTGLPLTAIPVESAMSKEVFTVHAADPAHKALDLMMLRQVHRVPVVDAQGALAGIVSLTDLVHRHSSGSRVQPDNIYRTLSAITRPRVEATVTISPVAPAAKTAEPKIAPIAAAAGKPIETKAATANPATSIPAPAAKPPESKFDNKQKPRR